MESSRLILWAVAGTISFNLVAFILAMQYLFLGPVHHHWVLPFMSVWLGLQLMAARWIMARPWPDLERVVRQTLLGTLAFACVVGSARVETIFLCYQYCAYKLAGQLGLAGGLFLWQTSLESPHPRLQKICRILGIVLLALGVLLAAVKFGSRNFKAGWLF